MNIIKNDIHTQTIDKLIHDLVTKKCIWDREVHLPDCPYECDLYIYRPPEQTLELFEIKSRDGTKQRNKAIEQLNYDRIFVPKLITEPIKIKRMFYVCNYHKGNYDIEEII